MKNQMNTSSKFKTVSGLGPGWRVASEISRELNRTHVGHLKNIPTEAEICRRYGVSRTTVREALQALRAAGLLNPPPHNKSSKGSDLSKHYSVSSQRVQEAIEALREGTLRVGLDHEEEAAFKNSIAKFGNLYRKLATS